MPYLYAVLCDCEGGGESRHQIAVISDDRDEGGQVIVGGLNHSYTYEWSNTPINRRGDHGTPHTLNCRGCNRRVSPITDARVGDIIDRIAPAREHLEVMHLNASFGAGWDELFTMMGGSSLRVIPFKMLYTLNSQLGKSQ